MTPEEKAEKIAAVQHIIKNDEQDPAYYDAWTFDENICAFVPPYPMPFDGKFYFWQSTTNLWVEKPPYPDDNKSYTFDFASATWVELI